MHALTYKHILCFIGMLALTLTSGCVNYRQRYENSEVARQNLEGRLANTESARQRLEAQASQDLRTIEELTRQIEEFNRTPAQATGLDGYDVAFDAAAGTITVTLPNTILFASGKASLKSVTNKDLDHILSVIKSQYSSRMIDVVGHTDSDPIKKSSWRDNRQLSSERALAVTRYLVDHGIAPEKVRSVARGSSMPVASNKTVAGKAKNRRVEIVIHMK